MAQTQTRPRERGQSSSGAGDRGQSSGERGQSSEQRAVVAVQQVAVAAKAFRHELDLYTPNLVDALPPEIPVEFFKRVLATAAAEKPELYNADRRTLFTSAVKCASDGLLPDGREAALVVYPGTKIKVRDAEGIDRELRIDAVQYMPMVRGIRKRMQNSGEVTSATAEAVYANDRFAYRLGDDPFIHHEPAQLGQDRGPLIGAYAIIRLRNGDIVRDVMGEKEILAAKGKSRAGDSSMLWKDFPWEAWKKTVLRRASKAAPLSATVKRIADREDEPIAGEIDHPDGAQLPRYETAALPEPKRQPEHRREPDPDPGPQFAVWDNDGAEQIFGSAFRACDAMRLVMTEAARDSVQRLDGAWESNQPLMDALQASGDRNLAGELAGEYDDLRRQLTKPAAGNNPGTATGEAQRKPQTRETAGPSDTPPEQEQARSAPPLAEAGSVSTVSDDGGPPEPEPGEQLGERAGQQQADDDERQSQEIKPHLRNGKPDWRVWAVAQFMPKVRRQTTNADLAFLIGDNSRNLEEARAALHRDDLADLNKCIDEQWGKVDG